MKQRIRHYLQHGKLSEAADLCRGALAGSQSDSETWSLMAVIQARLADFPEAHRCCLHAIEIAPENFSAHFILASVQQTQGDREGAISSYRRTIELSPSHVEALGNLGIILGNMGRYDEAITHLRAATRIRPRESELFYRLGAAYRELGRSDAAEQALRTAFELSPRDPRILDGLGRIYLASGKVEKSIGCFNSLLETDPDNFSTHSNLSVAYYRTHKLSLALNHCCHALRIDPDNLPVRQNFTQIFNGVSRDSLSPEVWEEVERSLHCKGIYPDLMVPKVIEHIKDNELFKRLSSCAQSDNFGNFASRLMSPGYLPFFDDRLLLAVLSNAMRTDLEFEGLLVLIRKSFLCRAVANDVVFSVESRDIYLRFLSALASHCFINEYVIYCGPDETQSLKQLRILIRDQQQGSQELPIMLMILASYQPLTRVAHESLVDISAASSFQNCVRDVIKMQIEEMEAENKLSQTISNMTAVTDGISCSVQEQYEESPYPRWVNMNLISSRPFREVFAARFPRISLPTPNNGQFDMLIAGCGTGRHALQCAAQFNDVHITAIDLSKASLSYAKRKYQEFGYENVDFYQADILALDSIDRSFQVIESVGVLHHLEDPARGLKILTDLLASNGLFHIGLYSTYARRDITAMREKLLADGRYPDTTDMKAARKKMIEGFVGSNANNNIIYANDFYNLSGFRDLLLHVKEHTFTLPQIEGLLDRAGLKFLGFELSNSRVLDRYKAIYPDDTSCTNLRNWHSFEQKYKDTFLGMYLFWCQKT